jgi:hypothetical protein
MKKYRTIKHFEFDPVNNTITVVFRYQDVQYIDGIPQVSPPVEVTEVYGVVDDRLSKIESTSTRSFNTSNIESALGILPK